MSDKQANLYKKATQEAVDHLIQPWPSAGSIGAEARGVLASGEGVYVHDENGRKLIDGPAGMWCTNVGHRNEVLAETLKEQAMELSYNSPWYTTNEPSAELARRIAEHAPGDLNHVFFTTGGSTAVESALRFAQFYSNVRGLEGKKKVICRDGGYHGSTYLSASLNGSQRSKNWMDFADDMMIRLSCPDPFRRPKGMSLEDFRDQLVKEFADAVREHGPENIAAFVGEPIMASGGVIVPPEGYFKAIRDICSANDILFIVDEVVTAFGRLGHVFASEACFDVVPDIITFAKGVTSGYFPLGGMVVSDRLLENLRASNHPEAMYAHGLTYSSHPIGCAVALKNLDILENDLLDYTREITPYFHEKMKALEELELVGEVRGMGLMACIECVADRESHNPIRLDTEVGNRIDKHCQELGLLVRPLVHMCVMSPPLVITRDQIDSMAGILHEGISRTMRDLRQEGIWQG
ncbi:adenosylmethionine-8-amino-7-oxononanoate aminotransferase [Hoeflea sp. IMCC20628]|uniref:aminotransferase n=1 Tax=Hoeflea sp. IMCC20628 TaxID=1620421 RepID=UPI00063AD9FE|nr:aminotransferase [Hoeflea sp. IMCC20628]AKH99846.1 adenosylmethionine-8-amino-7-oxononanoate aminotransferase [Hoeflea sp. IMCC20628]